MSKLSPKLNKVNTSYPCKYTIQSCETFIYFIVFYQFMTYLCTFLKNTQNQN